MDKGDPCPIQPYSQMLSPISDQLNASLNCLLSGHPYLSASVQALAPGSLGCTYSVVTETYIWNSQLSLKICTSYKPSVYRYTSPRSRSSLRSDYSHNYGSLTMISRFTMIFWLAMIIRLTIISWFAMIIRLTIISWFAMIIRLTIISWFAMIIWPTMIPRIDMTQSSYAVHGICRRCHCYGKNQSQQQRQDSCSHLIPPWISFC
jgi:hypothetical protein